MIAKSLEDATGGSLKYWTLDASRIIEGSGEFERSNTWELGSRFGESSDKGGRVGGVAVIRTGGEERCRSADISASNALNLSIDTLKCSLNPESEDSFVCRGCQIDGGE